MEPQHTRRDHLALLVDHLDSLADHPVVSDMDAGANPSHQPVTVVQIPQTEPAGPYTRWSFDVSATIMTFAGSSAQAWDHHAQVADLLLATTAVARGEVLVSSVVCTLEPTNVQGRTAPDWPGLVSTYTMSMRGQ